jgi:ABC-2 type transport system ATP-binding protein
LLQIRIEKFSYGKDPVLQNISLDLQQGECYGLIGSNGAGKTTLFHMLGGWLNADGLSITMN